MDQISFCQMMVIEDEMHDDGLNLILKRIYKDDTLPLCSPDVKMSQYDLRDYLSQALKRDSWFLIKSFFVMKTFKTLKFNTFIS